MERRNALVHFIPGVFRFSEYPLVQLVHSAIKRDRAIPLDELLAVLSARKRASIAPLHVTLCLLPASRLLYLLYE